MNRKQAVRTLGKLLLCLLMAECGTTYTARDSTDGNAERILPLWLGAYTGSVVYTYGDITDRKGGEGFPASLDLNLHKGLVVFELKTSQQPMSWFFFLPPTAFSDRSVEFIRNAIHLETEYQFRVTLSLSGKELNGVMKMYSEIPGGKYAPRGYYIMTFTKQER